MDPKEILKRKIILQTEREMYLKFHKIGYDHCIDEMLISNLYDIHTKNKQESFIMTYEDKKDVKKTYPGLFHFQQMEYGYIISKKN